MFLKSSINYRKRSIIRNYVINKLCPIGYFLIYSLGIVWKSIVYDTIIYIIVQRIVRKNTINYLILYENHKNTNNSINNKIGLLLLISRFYCFINN